MLTERATGMQDATPPQFLRLQEYARLASVSLATVRRRVQDGSLPAWQPGGHRTAVRIPVAALTMASTPSATDTPGDPPVVTTSRAVSRRPPSWMNPRNR